MDHQTSNIRHTKSQNLHVSHFFLHLSLPYPLRSGVKSGMKMQLEQRRQAMLQLHLSDQQFHCLLRCTLYKRFDGMLLQCTSQYSAYLSLMSATCSCSQLELDAAVTWLNALLSTLYVTSRWKTAANNVPSRRRPVCTSGCCTIRSTLSLMMNNAPNWANNVLPNTASTSKRPYPKE